MRYALISAFVLASVIVAGCAKKPQGPKTASLSPPIRPVKALAPAVVPKPKPIVKPPAPEPIVESAPVQAKPAWRWYTVKPSDKGFYSIARTRLGLPSRWKEIRDLNPGVDSRRLRVGQKIKIPAK